LRQAAPGTPFDHALFDLVVEPIDAPEPPAPVRTGLLKVRRKPAA
jgi:hypothetical protein